MPESQTFELGGLSWTVSPMDFDEQIEIECIAARTLGPALGAAIRVAASGIIPMLIDLLREIAGKGERFDLENIANYWHAFLQSEDGTRDPRLQQVWEDFTGVLQDAGGETIQTAIASIAMRVSADEVKSVFDLVLLSKRKTLVSVDGSSMVVSDYETLSRVLGREPAAKWALLSRAIRVTYGSAEEAEGDEGDE